MINQADGTRIFIGRATEIGIFEDMLKQIKEKPEDAKWILNIHGPGGIGKTQLLQQYIGKCRQHREAGDALLFTGDLADFYWTAHQRELGVFKTVAEQLDRKSFDNFFAALQNYQELFEQAQPDPFQVSERAARAHDRFFEACGSLGDRPVVIFFDTAEQATEAILDTLFADFLQLKCCHPQTLIVIAGRKKLELTGIPPEAIEQKELAAFTPQEIQAYLVKQGIGIPDDVAAKIAQLSEGKPILIVLAADWIRDGNNPDELVAYPPNLFEQSIVEKVEQLNHPENEAMMAMAHFYRRFDENILAYLLGQTAEEAAGLTARLSRFLVVKYRPPSADHPGSCLLHDEMRDLVNLHVWPTWDPMGDYRRKQTGEIVAYYAEKIEAEADRMERQSLRQERLYYWLSIDVKAAFAYYLELAEQAATSYDADLLEGINSEIGKFEKEFKKPLDASMRCRYEYYQALSLFWHERVSEAVRLLKGLLSSPQVTPDLRAAAYAHLVEFESDSGDLEQAIQAGLDGEKHFDGLLGALDDKDASYSRVQRDFGVLCNNLGYAYRKQGDYPKTIAYYEKALDHFAASGGAYVQRARTENNLGYALHVLGRVDEALARVMAALDIRRKLRVPYELGLSYNVLGRIRLGQWQVDSAQHCFDLARKAFKSAESERGEALVDVAHGRLLRQLGTHKEQRSDQTFESEREEYRQAEQMLERAVAAFRKFKDSANLSGALNELGTLFRNQKKWREAISCFNESLALSSAMGNRYREADDLQDMGIVYEITDQLDKALQFSQRAIEIAEPIDAKYLIARAQRTRANVFVKLGRYDEAFEAAETALIHFVMLDPEKSVREMFYEEWMKWIKYLVLQLPTREDALEKTDDLIRRWEAAETDGRKPANVYPGFVNRMRLIARDYSFLKEEGNEL